MTFYEAALRILEAAGKPLHVTDITQQSIAQSLLSHVGKLPEQTMLSRLAAMARRPRDRRVIVTAKDTFALADWQLPEDPEALAVTGVPVPNPEEDLPPLRPEERHPIPQADIVRSAGRGERKRRFDEDERGRRKRYPPLSEGAFELLSESPAPLSPDEVLAQGKGRELMGNEVTSEQLLVALLEDNQRRIDAGRRPQFGYRPEEGALSYEGSDSTTPSLELQTALAAAAGVAMEGGRPVLRAERAESLEENERLQAAKAAVKDARRGMARTLRRRLSELEGGTFEKSVVRMLQALGFRELKVAKRAKEGPLLTSRKKEGSLELRYAIRLHKGNGPVDRRMVQDLKKDLGHYSAQVGLLISAGELRNDARGEATSSGTLLFVWAGDALAEKFLEARAGVVVHQLEVFELDDRFFAQARLDSEESKARREERLRDKAKRGERPSPEPVEPEATALPEGAAQEEGEDEGEGPGEGELEADQAGAPGAPGERKRRRRRRRRRRGAKPDGTSVAPGAPPAEEGSAPASEEVAAAPPSENAEHPREPAEPVAQVPPPPAADSGGPESN